MLYGRQSHTATTGPDGKIYVVGGYGSKAVPPPKAPDTSDRPLVQRERGLLGTVEVYDPVTNTWTEKAPLHQARQMHAAAFGLDGKLYVFGGYGDIGIFEHHPKDPDDEKNTRHFANEVCMLSPRLKPMIHETIPGQRNARWSHLGKA